MDIGNGYTVTPSGEVYSLHKRRVLKGQIDKYGYRQVTLTIHGEVKYVKVHRIVARAFVDNPNNKPDVNHIDGNKTNNNADNLEWCTHLENIKHAKDNNFCKKLARRRLTDEQVREVRALGKQRLSSRKIAELLNVTRGPVEGILSLTRPTYTDVT